MTPAGWRDYAGRYRAGWKTIAVTSTASALQAVMGLPIAWLLKHLFDGAAQTALALALTLGAVVALYMVGDGLLLFAIRRNLALVKAVVKALRGELAERALQPGAASPGQSLGTFHSAMLQDGERIDVMSSAVLCRLLPASLSIGVLFGVLAWLSPALFVVTLVVLPVSWQLAHRFRRHVRARIDAFHASEERYNSGVIGLLQRIDLTRTHGAERAEIARHAEMSEELRVNGQSVAMATTAMVVLQNQTAVFTAIAVIFVGRLLIDAGDLTIGALLAFYVVLAMARTHLSSIATQAPGLIAGKAALDRVHALLGNGRDAPYRGIRSIAFDGHIALNDVQYRYGSVAVLTDASLVIRPGEITAMAGPNGTGKTTVARLVLGLDRPTQGTLLANGVEYDALAIAPLRARMAFVAQDPMIFAASARDNLLFGLARDPGQADIDAALDIVGAGFVADLEQGLDSWLGDTGVRLSGGQRQRLSIARAVLRAPALLILDEPTNHLGSREARAILGRFRARYPDSAILLISHDSDMLALADQVWHTAAPVSHSAAA